MRDWCLRDGDPRSATLISLLAYAGPRPESEALPLRGQRYASARSCSAPPNEESRSSERPACSTHSLAISPRRRPQAAILGQRTGDPEPTRRAVANYDWDNWRDRNFRAAAGRPVFPPATRTARSGSGLAIFARASRRS